MYILPLAFKLDNRDETSRNLVEFAKLYLK